MIILNFATISAAVDNLIEMNLPTIASELIVWNDTGELKEGVITQTAMLFETAVDRTLTWDEATGLIRTVAERKMAELAINHATMLTDYDRCNDIATGLSNTLNIRTEGTVSQRLQAIMTELLSKRSTDV